MPKITTKNMQKNAKKVLTKTVSDGILSKRLKGGAASMRELDKNF